MITFTIPGKPTGKGRPRFARRGQFVQAYTPKETEHYEALVRIEAKKAMRGISIIETAVEVAIKAFFIPPESWSKKKRLDAVTGKILPTVKPDNDNILKIICDGCNKIVYKDDAQAVKTSLEKIYSHREYVEVNIRKLP